MAINTKDNIVPVEGANVGIDMRTLEALPFCVFVVGRDKTIKWVNTAGFSFFVSQQIFGRAIQDIFTGRVAVHDTIVNVFETGNALTLYKVDLAVAGLGAKVLDMTVSSFGDNVLVCVTKDYDGDGDGDLHNGVRSIVSLLAHEIKNPLSGIRGASQLLAGQLSDLSQGTDLATLITEETDRITSLVNTLENLAVDTPVVFSGVNIHEVLDKVSALSDAGFGKKCNIIKHYDPSLPQVWGQEDKLLQVLINIFKNASEAFDYKKKNDFNIIIKTSFLSGVNIIIDAIKHQALCINISDNGCGIPVDRQADIFTPYVSGKKGGSGLGLSIVSRYVNAHKGRVRVQSDDTGTTFSIILPLEAM